MRIPLMNFLQGIKYLWFGNIPGSFLYWNEVIQWGLFLRGIRNERAEHREFALIRPTTAHNICHSEFDYPECICYRGFGSQKGARYGIVDETLE